MGIKERKEREKEARREEIIDAAEKVFFEKGVGVSTMDDIAQAAELSKGTLYLYYKSKEDLVLAVVVRGMEILEDMFRKAVETGEPSIVRIQNLGEAYYRFFNQYRNYFRLFYFFENPQAQSQVSEEMRQTCAVAEGNVWRLVISPIQDGINEGMLHKELNPMEAAVMLWSNSNGLMRLMERTEDRWTTPMGVDLDSVLQRSNAFLVEAMMTDKAKKQFGSLLEFHEDQNKSK